jgi:hypothetical protein
MSISRVFFLARTALAADVLPPTRNGQSPQYFLAVIKIPIVSLWLLQHAGLSTSDRFTVPVSALDHSSMANRKLKETDRERVAAGPWHPLVIIQHNVVHRGQVHPSARVDASSQVRPAVPDFDQHAILVNILLLDLQVWRCRSRFKETRRFLHPPGPFRSYSY